MAETFGVHEDFLVWRTRGVLRSKFSTLLIVSLLWVKVRRRGIRRGPDK
jgi:hypothetical protein